MKKYWKIVSLLIILLTAILAIIGFRVMKKESVNPIASASSGLTVSEQEVSTQDYEYISEDTQKIIFGEWEVSKLIGFTDVQNDYTNYPDGHDIIGDHIIIKETYFSSKGISKYERYQSEISDPIYVLSDIQDKLIISPVDSIQEDSEIYHMIDDACFQELYVQDRFHTPAAVNLLISSDEHLILEIDGAFYLLNVIKK